MEQATRLGRPPSIDGKHPPRPDVPNGKSPDDVIVQAFAMTSAKTTHGRMASLCSSLGAAKPSPAARTTPGSNGVAGLAFFMEVAVRPWNRTIRPTNLQGDQMWCPWLGHTHRWPTSVVGGGATPQRSRAINSVASICEGHRSTLGEARSSPRRPTLPLPRLLCHRAWASPRREGQSRLFPTPGNRASR